MKRKNLDFLIFIFLAKSAWASPFNADHVRFTSSKHTRSLAPWKRVPLKEEEEEEEEEEIWGCTSGGVYVPCIYSHAWWITVGDSGLCCCTCVTYFER